MKDNRYNDNRNYMRMEIDSEIFFNLRDDKNVYKGICKNLSHTGVQFITDHPVETGSELTATINSAGGSFKPLKVKLLVKRIEKLEDSTYLLACSNLKID